MGAVGKKVIFGRCADGCGEAGAKFLAQEANHFAHALKGKAAPAQLADDCHSDELIPVVNAAMAMASGLHDGALVPPLQLARTDSGQGNHVAGCELGLHYEIILFQTIK